MTIINQCQREVSFITLGIFLNKRGYDQGENRCVKHGVYYPYSPVAPLPYKVVVLMENDIVDRILLGLIFILALVIIVSLILKLTSHSPTDVAIIYSLTTMLIISSFKLHYDIGRLHEFSDTVKSSFKLMREENIQIRSDLREIKNILGQKGGHKR